MEKLTWRMLVLAAATIAPQVVTPASEPTPQPKHTEELSAEELSAVKRPEVYCIHDSGKRESDS